MKRILALAVLALLLLPAVPAFAQIGGTANVPTLDADQYISSSIGRGLALLGLGIGLGLIVVGAGRGIGNIGGHAADAVARQPEAGGRIFTTMIISAALIEGVALFAVVVVIIS
jgi:F-type H+-transporting ATPase subunit c